MGSEMLNGYRAGEAFVDGEVEDAVTVEVRQRAKSQLSAEDLQSLVTGRVVSTSEWNHAMPVSGMTVDDMAVSKHVDRLTVFSEADLMQEGSVVQLTGSTDLSVICYKPFDDMPSDEVTEMEEGQEVVFGRSWPLPHASFDELWENLFYPPGFKEKQLRYVETLMRLSVAGVSSDVVATNRILIFHGPPGTGKTTLCKALAQKLSIRLSSRFKAGQLVEIKSHALFSKYFSESGKMVSSLFERIRETLDDEETFVCILIDEVESLSMNRSASTNEPGDAVRVVNALLTQLDSIRRYPNVLVLTTSNLMHSVDPAFVDRADVCQFVPRPTPVAIYEIYRSCLNELVNKRIVVSGEMGCTLPPAAVLENAVNMDIYPEALMLMELARKSTGISGRAMRRLPAMALAHHLTYKQRHHVSLKLMIGALHSATMELLTDDAEKHLTNGIASLSCKDEKM